MKDSEVVVEVVEAFLELGASDVWVIEHGGEEAHLGLTQVVLVHPSHSLHLGKVYEERLVNGNVWAQKIHDSSYRHVSLACAVS